MFQNDTFFQAVRGHNDFDGEVLFVGRAMHEVRRGLEGLEGLEARPGTDSISLQGSLVPGKINPAYPHLFVRCRCAVQCSAVVSRTNP
jgi:hypothetical protein